MGSAMSAADTAYSLKLWLVETSRRRTSEGMRWLTSLQTSLGRRKKCTEGKRVARYARTWVANVEPVGLGAGDYGPTLVACQAP